MTVLRSRLLKLKEDEEKAKYAAERRSQIGSGDRSERIRTYNFPQNRVTDHRIGFTLHGLPQVMEGAIGPLIEALQKAHYEERLAALEGRSYELARPAGRAGLRAPDPRPAHSARTMLTVIEVVRKTSEFFASKGIESPRLNAELLVGHALGLPRMRLYLEFERPVGDAELGTSASSSGAAAGASPCSTSSASRSSSGSG